MRKRCRAHGLGFAAVLLVGMAAGWAQGQTPNECPELSYPARRNIKASGPEDDRLPGKGIGMGKLVEGDATGAIVPLMWVAWEDGFSQAEDLWDGEEDKRVRATADTVAAGCPPGGSWTLYRLPAFDPTPFGYCYKVHTVVDNWVAEATAAGLVVSAGIHSVPFWARRPACQAEGPWCAPRNINYLDFRRFVGMVAQRYNDCNGHGRIVDFDIFNEVNNNVWFDVGCGGGVACDAEDWYQTYADLYGTAYDILQYHQPNAKARVSLDMNFRYPDWDRPADPVDPSLSVQSFLVAFHDRLYGRQWRVGFHPYPRDMSYTDISADDLGNPPYGRVTQGNVGALLGWIHSRSYFPASARDVHITESGVSSALGLFPGSPGTEEEEQRRSLCDAHYNALGTPGVENFILNRLVDHPAEGGRRFGLHYYEPAHPEADPPTPEVLREKPSWTTWSSMSRAGSLACGFENQGFVRLTRYYDVTPGRGHWASSRRPPREGQFVPEGSWKLLRAAQAGTQMLYECAVGVHGHNVLTPDATCGGLPPLGPVGYIYTAPGAGRFELHRCAFPGGSDHFVSETQCYGFVDEGVLGYAERF